MVFVVEVTSGEDAVIWAAKEVSFPQVWKIVWFRQSSRINYVTKTGLRFNLVSVFSPCHLALPYSLWKIL